MQPQAKRKRGSYPLDGAYNCNKYCALLDADTATNARALGQGNLSLGLRRAVKIAHELIGAGAEHDALPNSTKMD